MINIPNIDLKIWNFEHKTVEIIAELKKYGCAQIKIDGEGGDCQTNGLYRLLDNICSTLGYDPSSISIHTCNQLEQHDRYTIVKHPPLYISSGKEFANKNNFDRKNWDSLKHFGMFVGRSSWQRLWIASHLWNNYKNQSCMTFHYDSNHDYHRIHLGFDELCHQLKSNDDVFIASEFIKHLPIKNDTIDNYPILTPAHFSISKLYPEFFLEIVGETFLSGQSFYPTEKTWRPFICQTPFLILGPKHFLSNLKKIGFRTFDRWWDESYDQDADLDHGKITIQSIMSTLKQLSLLTVNELEGLYIDMLPTLEHNKQRFLDLKENEFSRLWV
jgi:hypothetical protein